MIVATQNTQEAIDNAKVEDAPGVIVPETKDGEKNPHLLKRNYEVECSVVGLAKVKGYHLYWCTAHDQPLGLCDLEKVKENTILFAKAVALNDKTPDYSYSDGRPESRQNAAGQEPERWQRWQTPREMANDLVKLLKK